MKQGNIVFIGSTVVDVTIHVPHLPNTQEDLLVNTQTLSLGGCAFNASWMSHVIGVPYLLFSPIGQGIYGEFIKKEIQQYKLPLPLIESDKANGCCYCLVDEQGERTFLSYHGCEYTFQKEWFTLLEQVDITGFYLCGLELEEDSGKHIVEYIEHQSHAIIYFATGPRLPFIQKELIDRLFACSPIVHLNEEELLTYTACTTLSQAAQFLYKRTNNVVIITLGSRGCAYYDGNLHYLTGYPVEQVDTTGAGDCHIGTIIAYRYLGWSFHDAICMANRMASIVVTTHGATFPLDAYSTLTSL